MSDYTMGYGEDIDAKRVARFYSSEMDLNDMVVFAQDVAEAGLVHVLGADIRRLVGHCVCQGLVHTPGRVVQ